MAQTAATAARRALLGAGGISGYGAYKAQTDPPHIFWDLDHTVLCSVTPIPPSGDDGDVSSHRSSSSSFTQIDDDFPYEEGVPNTRTYWRPGARAAIRLTGLIARQHVFTAAQATYTANIMAELDPNGTTFETVVHRDSVPQPAGKDLTAVTDRMDRALLFDDRVKNFDPQGGENGVHVPKYDEAKLGGSGSGSGSSDAAEMLEMARLVGIAALALLAPDARDVARLCRSDEHGDRFPAAASAGEQGAREES